MYGNSMLLHKNCVFLGGGQNCSVAVCAVFTCNVNLMRNERILYNISGNVSAGWIKQVTELYKKHFFSIIFCVISVMTCYQSPSLRLTSKLPFLSWSVQHLWIMTRANMFSFLLIPGTLHQLSR